ncbi:MAG: hypothetical protein K2L08_05710 [Erysipelotrichaceae bacterium]|nr:hypothetical protein [Erysipelotrichaceae bacterium]
MIVLFLVAIMLLVFARIAYKQKKDKKIMYSCLVGGIICLGISLEMQSLANHEGKNGSMIFLLVAIMLLVFARIAYKQKKDKKIMYSCLVGGIICLGISIAIVNYGPSIEEKEVSYNIKQIEDAIVNKDYDLAKSLLDQKLKENPEVVETYLLFSDYYIALEKYLDAVDILERGKNKILNDDRIVNKLNEVKNTYASEIEILRKEKAQKQEEERKAREQAEAEAREKEKDSYKTVQWDELVRNPDQYINQKIRVVGKIAQIIDGNQARLYEDYDIMKSDTFMKKEWYLSINATQEAPRIIADDIVVLYGTYEGTVKVTRALTKVQELLPKLNVKHYEIMK